MSATRWILLFEPRLRPLWRVLLVLLLAAVTALALGPPPPASSTPHADKLHHVAAFAALAVTASASVQPRARNAWLTAVLLLAYGGAIEILQTQRPLRQGDWADLLADAAGIAVGLALATLLRRPWRPRPVAAVAPSARP